MRRCQSLEIAAALTVAVGLSACASVRKAASPAMAPAQERVAESPRVMWQTLLESSTTLADDLGNGATVVVDCDGAAGHVETICALADKLCELSAEAPTDRELHDWCADGKLRCERAREETARRCP